MNDMLTYSRAMLDSIAGFLWAEPIRYIIGFLLITIVIKWLKELMS